MLCYAMLCYAVLCCVLPCFVVLCGHKTVQLDNCLSHDSISPFSNLLIYSSDVIYDIQASTLSSTSTSPHTVTSTPSPALSHLYSVALVLCSILKGRPFTRQEVLEYRQAHGHYYNEQQHQQQHKHQQQHQQQQQQQQPHHQQKKRRGERISESQSINVPSYYTPNVEHLVQSSMLESSLWPESLRTLSGDRGLCDVQTGEEESVGVDGSYQYLTCVLELITLLKQCLRFQPKRREEQSPSVEKEQATEGVNTFHQLVALLETLKHLVVSSEEQTDACQTERLWASSDALSSSPPSRPSHPPMNTNPTRRIPIPMPMNGHTSSSIIHQQNPASTRDMDRRGAVTTCSSFASSSMSSVSPSFSLGSVHAGDSGVQVHPGLASLVDSNTKSNNNPRRNRSGYSNYVISLATLQRHSPVDYAALVSPDRWAQ